MKKTICHKNDIYDIYYNLKTENKPAPLVRVFEQIVAVYIEKSLGDCDLLMKNLNSSLLNMVVYSIEKNKQDL